MLDRVDRNEIGQRFIRRQGEADIAVIDHIAPSDIAIGLAHHLAVIDARRGKAGEGRRAGDRRPHQFGADAPAFPVDEVIGPEGMHIAGHRDDIGARFVERCIEPVALGRIAVPHVEIERNAETGSHNHIAGELTVAGRIPAQPGRHFGGEIGEIDPRHDHLIAENAPGLARRDRSRTGVTNASDLFGTEQGAALLTNDIALPGSDSGQDFRIAVIGIRRHREIIERDLRIAVDQPGFQHHQRGEITDLIGSIALAIIILRLAGWRPVIPGAQGGGAAVIPAAFALIMILGAIAMAVIGGLVIVPGHDPGRRGMERLQVRIGFVLGVAGNIIGQ